MIKWTKYIKALRKHGYIVLPELMERDHLFLDGITILVDNDVQKEMFEAEMPRMRAYFDCDIRIDKRRIDIQYTDKEKLEIMCEKNPSVLKLTELLELEI